MTVREQELYDAGLIGQRRPDPMRYDPAPRVRWERAVGEGVGIVARPAKAVRRLLLAMFPTRGDRVGAAVLLLVAVWFGGFVAVPLLRWLMTGGAR